MIHLRQLLVLLLMPLSAWSGLPQVGCRCSNGDILTHCPKLSRALISIQVVNVANTSTGNPHSCCCESVETSDCCRKASKQSKHNDPHCSAKACHCSAVLLDAPSRVSDNEVSLPDLNQRLVTLDLFVSLRLASLAHHGFAGTFITGPPKTTDLIVLLGHRLI